MQILNVVGNHLVSLLQPDYLACLLATDINTVAGSVSEHKPVPNEQQKIEEYRAREREYVEANKAHYQELKRKHKRANPEKYQEALGKYRETHREEINIKARERRQQDLEHYREIGRKSRDKHAEERNAYQREYGKANRDKLTLYTNNRRARKLFAKGSHTDAEWQALKAKYNFKCLCCGKQEPEIKLTRDHVRPLILGGSDSINNIQPLCARCNSKKSLRQIDYR